MRRSRLLIVLPAVGALVFTGLAPASADDRRGRDDASATVIAIDDGAAVSRNGREVVVEFKYKCENGDRWNGRVTADVSLDRGRYEADDVDLRCDDRPRWKTVTLEKEGRGEVRDGDRVKVTVTLSTDRERLDRESAKVKIERARGHR